MLSQGTPMMLMGDEYGHTKGGNNNTYGLDGTHYWRNDAMLARTHARMMRCADMHRCVSSLFRLIGPLNNFQWGKLEKCKSDLFRFFAEATRFRRAHPLLGREHFLGPEDVTWHESNWDDADSKFLAWTLHARGGSGGGEGSLYAAFNAHHFAVTDLPLPPPPGGCAWVRVADTSLAPPRDFDAAWDKPLGATYTLAPYSALLLRAARPGATSKL